MHGIESPVIWTIELNHQLIRPLGPTPEYHPVENVPKLMAPVLLQELFKASSVMVKIVRTSQHDINVDTKYPGYAQEVW